MKKSIIASAILFSVATGNALAVDAKTEIAELKARLEKLEKAQGRAPETDTALGEWTQHVSVAGVVEVEAAYADPYQGDSESDIVLATAELAIDAQMHDWVSAEIVFLYEEDDTDLEVDVATVTIANPDAPWYVIAGQQYLPFGSFETSAISDPLTLEIAETVESAVVVGFENQGFNGGAYLFNGDLEESGDNEIDSFGAFAGYGFEDDNQAFNATIGYINSIGDSDGLSDALETKDVEDYVGGVSIDANYSIGDWTFIAEYVAATDSFEANELAFNGSGAEPSTWNVEVDYGFELAGMGALAALAYQGSDEALALELPESRIIAALGMEIFAHTALSFEYAYDADYDKSDGGTDENASTVTAQLAYQF